jgi:hypothetical protein
MKQQGSRGAGEQGSRESLFFSLSPLPTFYIIKSYIEHSTKLNLPLNSLISLIIKLTNPVDKAVDKLWISCG